VNVNLQSILGVTFVLIAIYLILERSTGTDTIIRGLADAYSRAVSTLQGRG
jgi:hypothetical protein